MDEQFTFDKISELCSSFLDERWSSLFSSNLKVSKLKESQSNQVYHCQLVNEYEELIDQVVVRFYGSSLVNTAQCMVLEKSADVLIFYILSQQKLGPKLLGVFDGGRIEEYVKSTKMTIGQYESQAMFEILAKKLARIHSLKMPLKKSQDIFDYIKLLFNDFNSNPKLEDYLCNRKQNEYSKELLKVDFKLELNMIFKLLKKIPSKFVFSHNDLNVNNFLVKQSSKESLLADHVMIIDFEYCGYNYRWADISTYFSEICVNHQHPKDTFEAQYYPHLDKQLYFLKHYIQEVHKIDSNLIGSDLSQQLTILKLEVDFGSLVVNLIQTLFRLANANIDKPQKEYNLWEEAHKRYQLYKKLKQDFIQNYGLMT